MCKDHDVDITSSWALADSLQLEGFRKLICERMTYFCFHDSRCKNLQAFPLSPLPYIHDTREHMVALRS